MVAIWMTLERLTNIFQYLRDFTSSGDISQPIYLAPKDCNLCARQYCVRHRQKAGFSIKIISGPARTLFFNNTRDEMDLEEMLEMIVGE